MPPPSTSRPVSDDPRGESHPSPPVQLGVSYYGNRIPWRVQEDLKVIQEAGCTYVVHTLSEEDFEFYQPALSEIVQLSHDLGLKVWLDPWGVGQLFGGEAYSSLIAKQLSIRQVNSQGESLPIACPNNPAFKDYLLKWMDAAKRLKADCLFWDEPHFMLYPEPEGDRMPKLWACYCSFCQEKFKKLHGSPMPQQLTQELRAFKEEALVEFVRFLCDETLHRGMKSAVCLLPFENSSTVNDWSKVASIQSLHIFGTDPYWQPHQPEVGNFVGRFARRVVSLSHKYGKEPQLWILNFNIPKGEEERIRVAMEAGYQEGIRNFAAWSYYGAAYVCLRAGDPKKVWQTLLACYEDLAGKKA